MSDRWQATPLIVAAFENNFREKDSKHHELIFSVFFFCVKIFLPIFVEVCELLLEHEADIDCCDKSGRNCLWAAVSLVCV